MNEYIEIQNVDFHQINIDRVPYEQSHIKFLDNDEFAIIYKKKDKPITSVRVIKDRKNRIYKYKEEENV